VTAVAKEAEGLGVRSLVVMGDAAEKATVERMRTEAEKAFGGVDIYVSNAARRRDEDFFEVTDEEWHYWPKGWASTASLLMRCLPASSARPGTWSPSQG
jgi:NADP-dependent 3-hydroxy acid dehydrogenase YdfG